LAPPESTLVVAVELVLDVPAPAFPSAAPAPAPVVLVPEVPLDVVVPEAEVVEAVVEVVPVVVVAVSAPSEVIELVLEEARLRAEETISFMALCTLAAWTESPEARVMAVWAKLDGLEICIEVVSEVAMVMLAESEGALEEILLWVIEVVL